MSYTPKFCANCGAPLEKNALFCAECGTEVTELKNINQNNPESVQQKPKMKENFSSPVEKTPSITQRSEQEINEDKNETSIENKKSKFSILWIVLIILFAILMIAGYKLYIDQQQGKSTKLVYQKTLPTKTEKVIEKNIPVTGVKTDYFNALDTPKGNSPKEGKALYAQNGCASCHEIDSDATLVGPTLKGIGTKYDSKYLADALTNPDKDVPEGFYPGIMPPFNLPAEELDTLVKYMQEAK